MYDQPDNEPLGTVFVCVDCMLYREINETPVNGAPVWSLMPFADVIAAFDQDETGMLDFSSTPCRACGSQLAGARFEYAVWDYDTDAPAVRS